MKLYTYKETNSPYWVVAFENQEKYNRETNPLFRWCYENFGPGLGDQRVENSPFTHRWVDDIRWGELRFSQEKDLALFLLRWETHGTN